VLSAWIPPDRGALFVVTGPSGVGKSTLIHSAIAEIPGLSFSVSATTRAPRPGEEDGREYHFLTREAFDERVAEAAFLEHATVYGRSYGTLNAPTREAIGAGRSLILDVDLQGARAVRQRWADPVLIFILPPRVAILEERLRARGTDDEATIQKRIAENAWQIAGCGEFDYLVVNEDLAAATAAFQGILLAELSRRSRRQSWVERLQREIARPQ
jgi:guanylate kinase